MTPVETGARSPAEETLRALGYGSLSVASTGLQDEIAVLSGEAEVLGDDEIAAIAAALRPHGFRYLAVELEEGPKGA